MYTAAVSGGQFIALIGKPLLPWYTRVAREAEPSTSYEAEEEPTLPMQFGGNEVVPEERSRPSEVEMPRQERGQDVEVESAVSSPAEYQPENNAVPAEDSSSQRAQWLEQLAARYREMLRPRTGANVDAKRVPRRRATKKQPDFRPADVSALPAHMAAELVAPTTPPYIVEDNKILCRLPHCGVSNRGFETVAAWKKHVALSKSHLEDAFCGTCGHYLIVPPEMEPASVKAFITAHKKERCVGASKATMRQRQTELTWLGGLMRNTSHILVPG
uniref:C2H2-type domain-containing protein n=1 Tax=Ascaris lumbricoides TaxID=6252 RepID=A0A0M3IHI6_ASCLU